MFTRKNVTILSVLIALAVVFSGGLLAQTKCMLITEGDGAGGAHATDATLLGWLEQSYEVDLASGDEVNSHFYFTEDFQNYDFVFISESVSSSDTEDLKGAPTPVFYTELWASKWDIAGFAPTNTSPDYYGNTAAGENVVKIVDGSHPLAAGFATNQEITLVTDSENATDYLTYSRPQIEHIPIAVLTADETKVVVMGVETGTSIYNAENTNDGSMVTANRIAAVGVNANANSFLTEDAFKLMQAGIDWILNANTAVDDDAVAGPAEYALAQNYPNPFNPTTNISFTLAKSGHTTLKLYNAVGQEVATLVDGVKNAGQHEVTFDGTNFSSGIYFYELQAGSFHQVNKMVYMK